MMPQTIKTLLKTNYIECFDTLKEIAKDDSDKNNIIYPVEEERLSFINFDSKLAEKYYIVERLSSVDALDIQGDSINLIEFKNGRIKSSDLRLKGSESLITLYKFLKENKIIESFSEVFKYKINYYIILNKNIDKNGKHLNLNVSSNNINRDRLNKNSKLVELCPNYKNIYFKKIEVLSFEQFQKRYLEIYFRETLSCN